MLNTIAHGPEGAPRLIIAHGLFGSARNWGVISRRLAEGRRVEAVDMRNHGDSGWTDSHDYPGMAGDLATVIEADGPADVLGHSMGGKAAMTLALMRPDLVRRLIVVDVAPVPYDHDQSHNLRAMQAVDLTGLDRRSQADAQLASHIDDPTLRSFLTQSLDPKARRWRLNLDVLDRDMPAILSFPDLEGPYEGPTLFLTGGESTYVRPEHRDRIRQLFPAATTVKIKGAGHWLHAEKPREFVTAVSEWLKRTDSD